MDIPDAYAPLTQQSLGSRLKDNDAVTGQIGENWEQWNINEVGDGNLNLVFIVSGDRGSVIVKQALPYVRLVGDSWPLPLYRAFFEYHALKRQAVNDPGSVPEVLFFDEEQALIVMEYLAEHKVLRYKLIEGETVTGLGKRLGTFCARTAFRGSDLYLPADKRKSDTALFLGNVALCDITENLVFTDPYFNAEMNSHNELLDDLVAGIRANAALKKEVQDMKLKFCSSTQTLCHGDLHTGSVMCTDSQTRVIDPEFAFYGPMGFDLGMLLANYLMAFISQSAHRSADALRGYEAWILDTVTETVDHFNLEFSQLWHTERRGILYPESVFESQQHSSDPALQGLLSSVWQDALGFAGIEMHRRTMSLAHNADFESIEDVSVRARLEAINIMAGEQIIMGRENIVTVHALIDLVRQAQQESR
ncbi:MAG: S-methyl-5-thioribose kinase [Granulosicoccus sp.]